MNKKEVQKRVLQKGKPLSLSKFFWCEKTKTFLTIESDLVLDFSCISYCTFDTGSNCTFKTDSNCTFKTDSNCTFKTGFNCTFKTGFNCTFKTGSNCKFDTYSNCTFKTGSNCKFDTYSNCTFKTDSHCTFDTGSNCTFKTDSNCTFDTDSNCKFDTAFNCTFDTGSICTFDTGSNCTFKTGSHCVIIRRDIFEIIQPQQGDILQLCPYGISGYLINGKFNEVPHIIADGILSKVVNRKGDIYKVINHGEKGESYLIKRGDTYSHGKTLKEAKESLVYKLSDRDISKYKDLTLDSTLSKSDMIQCYITITGACSFGTKYFVDNSNIIKKEYSIKEVIKLTKGQYGNEKFKEFFNVK